MRRMGMIRGNQRKRVGGFMHKKISTIVALLLSVSICFGLSACSEDQRELIIHEPGEYKGTTDPLLAAGQHPELNHRFKKIQTDR